MNYSKHSKPIKRKAQNSKPKRDVMGMNFKQTRDAYKNREIPQDAPSPVETASKNGKIIYDEQKSYKKPIRGVITPYGKA